MPTVPGAVAADLSAVQIARLYLVLFKPRRDYSRRSS